MKIVHFGCNNKKGKYMQANINAFKTSTLRVIKLSKNPEK